MKKTAFVFGGGGSKGAVQVGMVRRLFEKGIRPDIVTGVSIGALNGYFAAQHKIDELDSLWRKIENNDEVYQSRWITSALMFLGWQWGYPSIYKPGKLSKTIVKEIKERDLNDFKAELRIGAVDLVTGNFVSINQTHSLLHRFIMGCVAIPMVFPPVKIKAREDKELAGLYVDGCVRNITPVAEAARLGATDIHVFLTSSDILRHQKDGYNQWMNLVSRSVDINMHEMFLSDIERLLLLNIKRRYMDRTEEIKLHLYHTQDAKLQNLLDFDPEAIRDCIDLGYQLGDNPKDNDELSFLLKLNLDERKYKFI